VSISTGERSECKARVLAIRLEQLWGQLATTYEIDTIRGYPSSSFHHAAEALRFDSRYSSALGTTNSALPQSKQTISCEYTKTACLSMFSSPERRMPVSALNVSMLIDPHELQNIGASTKVGSEVEGG
jgi:hypothetical protein